MQTIEFITILFQDMAKTVITSELFTKIRTNNFPTSVLISKTH